MFQNRCPFFYNSSAFLLSFLYIVWISFCPGTSSLEPFWLFYDQIASYYTKAKWQWRKGYLFCFESYHFDKKMFLYICLFFSFWSKASQGLESQFSGSQGPGSQVSGSRVSSPDFRLCSWKCRKTEEYMSKCKSLNFES